LLPQPLSSLDKPQSFKRGIEKKAKKFEGETEALGEKRGQDGGHGRMRRGRR
jgi:hypothetical protein